MAHRTWVIFMGIVLTVAASFTGLVAIPRLQLAGIGTIMPPSGVRYPIEPSGSVAAGRRTYISLGCIYCHSQQVRPPGFGADIERGWGMRQSAPRDYIFDEPPLLGTMRTGPDLANIGARQVSREWHLRHLYNPRITSPGSVMPAFPFLFEEVERNDQAKPPENALSLPPAWSPSDAYVVPTQRANQLVDYLLSLNQSMSLEEVVGGG